MPASEVKVGLVSPAADAREALRAQIHGMGSAQVALESDQYPVAFGDRVARRFQEAEPDVIVVDLQEPAATLDALRILHARLPRTWLFVASAANDPALIIEVMRAGAREYLVKPIAPKALAQAFERFVTDRQRHERQRAIGQVFGVTSVKGGAGATTVTINLAASVAGAAEAQVAIADLNAPTGDAAGYLNLTPQYTMADAVAAASRLDALLLGSFMPRARGLAVLAGPRESWAETPSPPGGLSRVFEVLMESHDHTFADVPATLDREQLRTVTDMSTALVVLVTAELPALWRAKRLLSFLDSCGNSDKVRLVLNRARRGDPVSDREIEKVLGHEIFWKLPNNYNAAVQGINEGVPLVLAGASELARSFQGLAGRLTGLNLAERRRGLLGLLQLSLGSSGV
jgi:pilus assembly protein CpaE